MFYYLVSVLILMFSLLAPFLEIKVGMILISGLFAIIGVINLQK